MSAEFGPRQEEKESSVFFLSKQSVEKALESIREDAHMAKDKEAIKLHNSNIDLELYLIDVSTGIKENPYKYITMTEGALYTYRILRIGAEEKGEKLPRISQAQIHTMHGDRQHRMRFGTTMDEDLIQSWERTAGGSKYVKQAVEQMAAYRSEKDWFYAGAGLVIEAFEKHEERESFKKQFNIQS